MELREGLFFLNWCVVLFEIWCSVYCNRSASNNSFSLKSPQLYIILISSESRDSQKQNGAEEQPKIAVNKDCLMSEMGFPKQKPRSVRKSQDAPSSEAHLYQFRPELSAKRSLNRKCIALFLSLCLFHPAVRPCEPDSTRARVHAAKIVCRINFSGFCLNLPHWLIEETPKN